MVAGSLAAGRWVRVLVGGGCESASDQGAGAKRRLAGEAVWFDGDGGLRSGCYGGTLCGPTAERRRPTSRGGRRPPRPEPGRLKATLDSSTTFAAEGLGRSLRRRVWRACPDTRCASGRDGRILGARKTSGGARPGGGLEESRPGLTTAKPYRGAEGRDSSDGACGGRGVTARSDPAAELREAADCPHGTDTDSGNDTLALH